jgi:uncharacterized membrane protein
VDDPSLWQILVRDQQGMAGTAVTALLFSATYSIAKGFDVKTAMRAAFCCVVFGTFGWFFVTEWLHLPVIWIVPVGLAAAYVTVPITRAWARRDDRLAERALDIAQRRVTRDED